MECKPAALSVRKICVLLLLLLPLAVRAAASPTDSSALTPYVRCDGFAGGVRGVTLDRRPEGAVPWRDVGFGDKIERVSVVEGYRVTYSYPRTLWFATLKAERSDPARYAEDKRIVTENFTAIAKGDDAALSNFSDNGFAGQTLTKRALRGRTLGITQILSDEDAVIVTIYFANQAPENRAFQTHEEFLALRDDFVRGYVECVARKKAAMRR